MQACLALISLALTAQSGSQIGVNPPKLVVLVSIDQCRADYIDRFAPHYLPAKKGNVLGGFRFLSETGVRYRDAHHDHLPTATGPGHSILMTGSEPFINGIIGNDWFDRDTKKSVYCVDDASVETVGGTSKPMSPKNLKVTTVGDELKMATGGKSKVIGISFKDRAAILMAGHAADYVVWLDSGTGNWVTSSWYGALPSWATKINSERLIDQSVGKAWEPLLSNDAYTLTRKAPGEANPPAGKVFSHVLGKSGKPDKGYYGDMTTSGFGQSFLFDTVERAISAEQLGTHSVPDILVVNLATNDYVGHRYGPNSPEVMDISVRTDRLLSQLFNSLNKQVPGGIDNVAIVVTADHGVCPIPEEAAKQYKSPFIRVSESVGKQINNGLEKKYGPGQYVSMNALFEQNLYIDHDVVAAKGLNLNEVIKSAADIAITVPGIYSAVTKEQLMNNGLPRTDWATFALQAYMPSIGGDLLVLEAPGVYLGGGTGTGHGSAWSYDSHIPILTRWGGQTAQQVFRRVSTHDIASTLCQKLGIEYPTGNIGSPLREALGLSK